MLAKKTSVIASDVHSYSWFLIIIVAFAICYLGTLSLNYVEGDDASGAIYHALGRNATLQPPYSPYHAMLDWVLSILPAEERVIMVAGTAITAVSTPIMIGLMLSLVFGWIGTLKPQHKLAAAIIALLAIPEFFYFGLLYMPSVVGMCGVLLSHKLIRRTFQLPGARQRRTLIIFSIIAFAIGGASRWDVLIYGAVIVADIVYYPFITNVDKDVYWRKRGIFGIAWGLTALTAWLLLMEVLGYGISSVREVGEWAGGWLSAPSLLTLVRIQSLATPATIVLVIIGIAVLFKKRNWRLFIIVLLSCLAVTPWLTTGIPKLLLPAFPAILLCISLGLIQLLELTCAKHTKIFVQIGFIFLLFLPWVIGVRVDFGTSAWGPGYELRDYDYTVDDARDFSLVVLDAGTAIPTPEGPRALFGHFKALFGGGWRSLINHLALERTVVVRSAIDLGAPIVVLQGSGNEIIAELLRQGYSTSDPSSSPIRHFIDQDGKTVTLLKFHNVSSSLHEVEQACEAVNCDRAIVFGYPSTLRSLFLLYPRQLTKIAATAAIVEF